MPRFRVQEWIWIGLFAVAVAVMALVILDPWIPALPIKS